MRSVSCSALMLLLQAIPALALDDEAVCNSLRSRGASGLYLAYPAFSSGARGAQADCSGVGFCLIRPARGIPFEAEARFYYVPSPVPRSEEGVWHVRTQTKARNLDGADQAYLARPSTRTRCSPVAPLEAFDGGGGYVDTADYIDHHAAGLFSSQRIPAIARRFHFEIQDTPRGSACIRTDSRRIFGDLNGIYGFEGVPRPSGQFAQTVSIVGTARAAATPYAGLSSEFAYHDRSEAPCFGFAAPKPTRTEYLNVNVDWKPLSTTIWIKRLRGREVIPVSPISVSWTP